MREKRTEPFGTRMAENLRKLARKIKLVKNEGKLSFTARREASNKAAVKRLMEKVEQVRIRKEMAEEQIDRAEANHGKESSEFVEAVVERQVIANQFDKAINKLEKKQQAPDRKKLRIAGRRMFYKDTIVAFADSIGTAINKLALKSKVILANLGGEKDIKIKVEKDIDSTLKRKLSISEIRRFRYLAADMREIKEYNNEINELNKEEKAVEKEAIKAEKEAVKTEKEAKEKEETAPADFLRKQLERDRNIDYSKVTLEDLRKNAEEDQKELERVNTEINSLKENAKKTREELLEMKKEIEYIKKEREMVEKEKEIPAANAAEDINLYRDIYDIRGREIKKDTISDRHYSTVVDRAKEHSGISIK